MFLYTLINDPLLSIRALQKQLETLGIQLSYHRTNKIYEELKKMGFLRSNHYEDDPVVPGNRRLKTEVEANYIPSALGLVTQHVFFKNICCRDNIELFNRICDEHPYTHYRAVCVGRGVHLYAHFDIPQGTEGLMDELYQIMLEKLGAQTYEVITQRRSSNVDLDMHKWLRDEARWDFSTTRENHSLQQFWDQEKNLLDTLPANNGQSHINLLDKDDLFLLRELTINAKVKPVDLGPIYKKDASTISRRINKISAYFLGKPALFCDWAKFDVSIPLLILGEAEDARTINHLYLMLESQALPFRSLMRSDGLRFMLISYVPPSFVAEVGIFIWSKVKNAEIMTLNIHNDNSWVYPFYPLNFDLDNNDWKKERDYLIDTPLRNLGIDYE